VEFLVGSASLLTFLLVLVACRDMIQKEMVKKQQLKWIKGDKQYLDEDLDLSIWERFLQPLWLKMRGRMSKLSKSKRRSPIKKKESSSRLESDLRQAGLRITPSEFLFIRVLATVGILLLGFVGAMLITQDAAMQFLMILVALTVAVATPPFFLRGKIKSRQLNISNQMPSVMDVLGVSVEAGLGFDAALAKVIERFEGPLIDELSLVYREVQMGRPRREALTSLSQRNPIPELQTFASAIIQSEKFGTPIKNVLRVQAQQLRVSRKQQAQEKGMKAPIRMMIPMVIFIFPVIFIILLGPTIINALGGFN
jgi:tight adherence protein C